MLPHTSLPLLKCEQTSHPSLGLLPQTKMEIAEVRETIHLISIPNCPEWRSTDIGRGHSGHLLKRLPTIRVRRTNILWFPSQTGGGKKHKKDTELSFNIPYHKSGLEKWLFFTPVFHVVRLKCYSQALQLTSETECVSLTHVCVCVWLRRHFDESASDWRGEQRADVWEASLFFYFFF